MADLIFGCTGASAEQYSATPTLNFQLTITERSGIRVHAIALRCQIRIEPHRRRYSAAEIPVPVTYDLEVASARYLHGLDNGTLPLIMLFSGTVFLATETGYSVELVPWSSEATYRMPVTVWQDLVDFHFPGSAWLAFSRERLDELAEFKAKHALPTWDATLAALLAGQRENDPADAAPDQAGPPGVVPEARQP